MAGNYKIAKVPIFDGDEDNYNRWEIKCNVFTQVESMASAFGKQMNVDILASLVEYDKTEKAGTTDKVQKAKVKTNRQAIAYLALALKPMEL